MRKIICVLCALAAAVLMCACGGGQTTADSGERCDIDLTAMNTSIAYSQVVDFWNNPDSYIGKTVKIHGTFNAVTDNGRNYYSCNIGDTTACCSAGIEFVLKDSLKYPGDYPDIGAEFTVIGEFETYVENGYVFCQLKNARFC